MMKVKTQFSRFLVVFSSLHMKEKYSKFFWESFFEIFFWTFIFVHFLFAKILLLTKNFVTIMKNYRVILNDKNIFCYDIFL
jgi:hypothetical protein